MSKAVFYMMVGLPGSGKSTYAKTLKVPIVSSDSIRAELFGDENDQDHNAEVFTEVEKRIRNYLKNGESCTLDATNLSRKRRRNFLKTISNYDDVEHVAILIATDIDLCLKQNKQRDRVVPEDVIMRMFRHLSFPRIDEGFDRIIIVKNPNNSSNILYEFSKTTDFNQDNPHHILTLDKHMLKAEELVSKFIDEDKSINTTENVSLKIAAKYHDIGKLYCKTYEKYDGTIDTVAHYYNHADVGAYIAACCMREPYIENVSGNHDLGVCLTYILLILWHMEFFSANSDLELTEKVSNLYGKRFARLLNHLHAADVDAH